MFLIVLEELESPSEQQQTNIRCVEVDSVKSGGQTCRNGADFDHTHTVVEIDLLM